MTKPSPDSTAARRAAAGGPGRDRRRGLIIDAAIAAIEADGPQALTEQIADRAGLARTHVYRHFASKEELDFAVARRAHRDLTERIRANLEVEGTPFEIIRQPLAQHVIWADEHPNLYRFLIRREYRRGPEQERVGGGAFTAEVAAAMVRYIPQLADTDLIDATIVAVHGLVDASVSWWLDHRRTSRDEIIDRLTSQCWLLFDHRLRELGIRLDPTSAPSGAARGANSA
ncbi:TetR/AcrR family transcriptional regulator [Antrihabitans stalactiti]|uniref:TetR/AcrR family transcriptional regulator n=1 Tax=Antrihabitans stalactiti TaxID=2584121 RepID=A0A848KL45_9NOCA|nr:TetR/AcrR family transcriptional regulator [Antrihabitans stalactiti]NMN98891.1 TetR/AcrR family transcriptional regulator [Antrihabitans stalactiti]